MKMNPFARRDDSQESERDRRIRSARNVGLSPSEASDVATAYERSGRGEKWSESDRRAVGKYHQATDRKFRWWGYR